MADILSVEVGDQFKNNGTDTILEVIKIWFEFSLADQRWETSVAWEVKNPTFGNYPLSGKACDFVKTLRESSFVRVNKEESSSNGATTAPTSSSTYTLSATDVKRRRWEEDFRISAARYGLCSSDLGRMVNLGKNRPRNFKIIGAKPSNYKMPILVQGKRGGIYKITAATAKAGLA